MNNIHLTSNRVIRNAIILLDFCVMLAVIMLGQKMGHAHILRPNVFLMACTVAMTCAQTMYSTLLHHHYTRFDKVLARTTQLVFSFGLVLVVLCIFYQWAFGGVAEGKTILLVILFIYVAIIACRMVETVVLKFIRKKGRNSRALIFIGETERIEEILFDLDHNAATGLRLRGYYAPSPSDSLTAQMPYRGDYSQLDADLDSDKRLSDEVYCALPPGEKRLNKKLIHHSMHHASHYYYVPTFLGEFGEFLKPSMIGEQVVFANFSEPLLDPLNRAIKRLFDVVCSGLALLVLLPFFPIIAIIIKVKSPGPVFFRQARTGIGGKDFMMLKFRSMHVNVDADKVQATKDDPRKYPFGSFMRSTSIDEFPQLWNIFVGDMSIVGPRPHMRAHTDEYSKLIDDYMLRHFIRPGLTGWAQTTGYRGETAALWQMEGRVKRDIWYIQNWSFWLDIRIILKTALQIIRKDKQAY